MIVWPHRLCGFGALGEATGSDHVDDSWSLHVEHLWVSILGNLCSQTQEADRVVALEWSLKACLPYSCDWAFCGRRDCDAGERSWACWPVDPPVTPADCTDPFQSSVFTSAKWRSSSLTCCSSQGCEWTWKSKTPRCKEEPSSLVIGKARDEARR